jgi:hypothetical protein
MPRENADGKVTSVSIVNFTAGESGELKLRIRRPLSEKFSYMSADWECCPEFSRDGSDYILTLKSLPAFGQGTVFVK